jgi:NAD(P)-dependent dehydrogenase (short-subunit alcohol dehydrogenase family)
VWGSLNDLWRFVAEYGMAQVLIIGASKGIGLETTRQALEAGHRVRAFARSAADIRIQ